LGRQNQQTEHELTAVFDDGKKVPCHSKPFLLVVKAVGSQFLAFGPWGDPNNCMPDVEDILIDVRVRFPLVFLTGWMKRVDEARAPALTSSQPCKINTSEPRLA
jgi:hypothetical protein